MKPERIYIATRLSGENSFDYLKNFNESIEVGLAVWNKGHYPFIPGWDYIFLMRAGRDTSMNRIYEASIAWLAKCDAILVHNGYFDLPLSIGVEKEVKYAMKTNMKIYWKLNEIPDLLRGGKE